MGLADDEARRNGTHAPTSPANPEPKPVLSTVVEAPRQWLCCMDAERAQNQKHTRGFRHGSPSFMCLRCEGLFCEACLTEGFSCPRCRNVGSRVKLYW